jgi:hypothetical protein
MYLSHDHRMIYRSFWTFVACSQNVAFASRFMQFLEAAVFSSGVPPDFPSSSPRLTALKFCCQERLVNVDPKDRRGALQPLAASADASIFQFNVTKSGQALIVPLDRCLVRVRARLHDVAFWATLPVSCKLSVPYQAMRSGSLKLSSCSARPSVGSRGRRLVIRGDRDFAKEVGGTTVTKEMLDTEFYVACNRFSVKNGAGPGFEKRWATRKSRLAELDGFRYFQLMRRVLRKEGEDIPKGEAF